MRFDFVAGDLQPPLTYSLPGITGPLPAGTTAKFEMAQVLVSPSPSGGMPVFSPPASGGVPVDVSGAASFVDPTTPIVQAVYQWVAGDTSAPGVYRGRFTLMLPGGPQSFPPDEPLWIVINTP